MAIADAWYLKNAADQQYGPVPKSQIVEWINEGRIDDTFQVRQAEGTWQQTSQLFRELPRRETRDRTRKRTEDRPGTDVDNATDNTLTAADDYLQPHHGEVVLALSVLGLFCCGCGLPLSLIATVWGALQLGKIRDGTVDPSGRGMLRAGSLLGMVPCVIIGLYLAYLLLRMIVG